MTKKKPLRKPVKARPSKGVAFAPRARQTPRSRPRPHSRPLPVPVAASEVRVVGVGASAGGLEAFSQVLRTVPDDGGLALVFVQHLAPQHDSALVALLSGQTTMPVLQASEGLRVEANHVYVIPPNVKMEMRGDELHLMPRPDDRSKYTPIDAFLISLAAAVRDRAIAVILSGTASDGAIGVRDVKNAGGITIAQAPDSAKYDGMPRAAIATGMVDLVLPPQAIGAKLAQLSIGGLPPSAAPEDIDILPEQLQGVYDLLRPASGVDFKHYKLPTIKRRLFRRMALHRLTDVAAYISLLQGSSNEVRSLYQDLLIHVTRFFREPESFASFVTHVFPSLVERRSPDHPIRVWVSGCATGEEAYSLAITLIEFLQKEHADTRVQIFATDVSETAIEQARAGIYTTSIEADVSAERLRRFFVKVDGGYRVTKMIRDLCVFARQDLTRDPPFSHLDLILCRNVLIYMDAVLQKRLLAVFDYALNPGGFLVLGQAETVGAQATLFTLVDKRLRIHRKKDAAAPAPVAAPVDFAARGLTRTKAVTEPAAAERALQSEVSRVILDRYPPAGVVVDNDLQIVQFRGQTGAFLEPAPGEASLNLLKMAREGLLYGLRTAIHTARKTRRSVRKDGLQVRAGQGWKPVNLEVIPLTSPGRLHYLVLFDTLARTPEPDAVPAPRKGASVASTSRSRQVQLLQRELAASREYLQSIIQELEAANEELQSANEEILSSNEELQSTNEELDTAKEELQSTNEEMNTVNEELHARNEELGRVNSDLINLVASVQIAIVIVNANLRIRRFTPMAEKLLNLIPSDLDRSIGHINPNIDCPNLEQLIADCIDSVSPVERKVQDRQGRWYSLRIRPYKNLDNKIDGAVLVLFDADAPRAFEERMHAAIELGRCSLEGASNPMALLGPDLRVMLANGAFATLIARTIRDIRDKAQDTFLPEGWGGALRELSRAEPGTTGRVTLPIDTGGDGADVAVNVHVLASHEVPATRLLLLATAAGPAID